MHPLRSMEPVKEKPVSVKSEAVKQAESEAAWKLLDGLWGKKKTPA